MSKGTPLIVGIGKSITDENDQIQSLPILSHAKMIWFCLGAWLSLARAPGSGPGGRRFKSSRPDSTSQRVRRVQKAPLFSCPHECPHGRGLIANKWVILR